MADVKKLADEETRMRKIMEEANDKLLKESEGRPYLSVLIALHEIDREGGQSRLAPQWNWHSNINTKKEGRNEREVEAGKTLMKFMLEQLKAVSEHPENGIKKKYGL